MEVAEPGRSRAARPARDSRTVGISAVLPIVTVFFWLCLLYAWEAWGAFTPWLNSDEFERAQLSRAVAATGHEGWRTVPHAFDSLYVYLIAPAWWLHDTSQAYGVAKGIGVATMTAVVFPAYLLARMYVSRRWALFAAAGAGMIPALAYSSMLLSEPLAYPWAALCFFLVAKAMVTRRRGWIGAAVVACAIAPLIRSQLGVVVAGAASAAALYWFTGSGGLRVRRNWRLWHWVAFAVVLVVAAAVVTVVGAHESNAWSISVRQHKGEMIEYALRSAGALTIGVGVLPMIAGLTALGRPRGEPRSRERRAFTWLLASMLAAFGVYAGAKAAYVHTLGLTELVERDLIYLAPLLFVGTAIVLERRRPALIPLVASTVLVLYLVTTTPYHMDIPVFFDAPGLAVLPGLHRGFGLTSGGATALLVVLALGSAALLLYLRYGSRAVTATVAAVAAGIVLVWNAYGEVSFAREAHKAASSQLAAMPRPLDWVDRAVPGGAQVTYLGQSIDDPYDILQLEFWNRKVQRIWSTDNTAPGPGPTLEPDITSTDGALAPSDVGYMVADSGVVPVGTPIEQKFHHGGRGTRTWTLYRITPPLRLRRTIDGVYPDGWGRPITALNQFSSAGGGPTVVRVHVYRTGAGRLYPATVKLTVGTLTLMGPTGGRTPAIANVISTRTISVPDNLNHTFVVPAPAAPFRVETSVTPFPHSRNPIIGDPRDLGAQISYSVEPAR